MVEFIGSFAVDEENCYEIIIILENQPFALKNWTLGFFSLRIRIVTNDAVEFICSEA